ncbi:MAG: FAD-dependent monooxygenase [Phaeodactylibacter sp.]|nr:FAD-dependent monooxygenase [Phaeodactylibacter sp.]
MDKNTSIAIIGGGIGGLTTAIALRQHGFNPVVYEAASELRPIGAGITLAINAMRVFNQLGLADKAIQSGHPIEHLWITDKKLRPITRTALSPLIEEFGTPNLGIHRGALQQLLVNALPDNSIQTGKALRRLEKREDGVALHFEDGETGEAAAVIAADGIHSVVRRQLFPSCRQRSSGQVCWRGVCPADTEPWNHRGTEAWAPGMRFGIVPIAEGQVYWFAVVNEKPGTDWEKLSKNGLLDTFRSFTRPVLELVENTPADKVIYSSLNDLEPLPAWFSGHVALLGDAAHATTPNMGQGACQAIEDAFLLASCLSDSPLQAAFYEYQKLRKPKADAIVRQSRRLGRIAQLNNPALGFLRNRLMAMVPSSIALASLRELVKGSV